MNIWVKAGESGMADQGMDWAKADADYVPPEIDTTKPSVARVYDAVLGGKDKPGSGPGFGPPDGKIYRFFSLLAGLAALATISLQLGAAAQEEAVKPVVPTVTIKQLKGTWFATLSGVRTVDPRACRLIRTNDDEHVTFSRSGAYYLRPSNRRLPNVLPSIGRHISHILACQRRRRQTRRVARRFGARRAYGSLSGDLQPR